MKTEESHILSSGRSYLTLACTEQIQSGQAFSQTFSDPCHFVIYTN